MNFKYYIISVISTLFLSNRLSYYLNTNEDECVGVAPGGIPGFWNSINKIKNFDDNESFVCASSGCLAIISKQLSFDEIFYIANLTKYTNKSIEETKNTFIKLLVDKVTYIPDIRIFTMNVYGTCREWYLGKYIYEEHSKKLLKKILIKTTDIPYFTSDSLTFNGQYDGGFCFKFYNKCSRNIRVPKNIKFLLNSFNKDISYEDIQYFYNFNN